MGLFVGLFMAVFKGVFMLAAWVIQTITFIVWKLTTANKTG
jgi:predicted Co/Zn/Cd cation transporter (cation efflux family)